MSSEVVSYAVSDDVATIAMDQPHARNALSNALEEAWEYLRAQLTLALSTDDLQESVAAFFEKREPVWSGR